MHEPKNTPRVILSFVCALSLVSIPMSYSWAQSSNTVSQQDQTQTDRNSADQRNQDVNQDNSINSPTTDTNQRQKPASEPNTTQRQSQTKSQTEKSPTTTSDQSGQSPEGLPASAGELPLLARSGVLSLSAADDARLFARAKSTR